MILTLYYMAATWIQAWRLSSMRAKISDLLQHRASLVLYNEPNAASLMQDGEDAEKPACGSQAHFSGTGNQNSAISLGQLSPTTQQLQFPSSERGVSGQPLRGISSKWCENQSDARVVDLLWYVGERRGCSIYPQQRVNLSGWIKFPDNEAFFPFEIKGKGPSRLSDATRMYLLVEADIHPPKELEDVPRCHLEQFGIMRAWSAKELLAIILETDLENLAKLGTNFMHNRLALDTCLEMSRIESVAVEGVPCYLLNGDAMSLDDPESLSPTTPDGLVRRKAKPRTLDEWHAHFEIMQAFTEAATCAAAKKGRALVEGDQQTILVAGRHLVEGRSKNSSLAVPEEVDNLPSGEASCMDDATSMVTASAGGHSSHSLSSLDSLSTVSAVSSHVTAPTHLSSRPASASGSTPGSSAAAHSRPPGSLHLVSAGSPRSLRTLSTVSGSACQSTLSMASVGSTEINRTPNVIIYSDSTVASDSVSRVLRNTLHHQKYIVYSMTKDTLISSSAWIHNTRLLVVSGSVPDELAQLFLSYVFAGGRVLCLCSDLLHLVLPTFRTAEVRHNELVRFSYARWKNVPMMHHVFCYQASPVRTRFAPSHLAEAGKSGSASSGTVAPRTPASVEVQDSDNKSHTLKVEVLGAEETWQSPSLLLATAGVGAAAGKIVFSQVHLEVDPSEYESEEGKYSVLRQSDEARREIFKDLLTRHLDMECEDTPNKVDLRLSRAYFLGRHELKQELLSAFKKEMKDSQLVLPKITLQFCGQGVTPPEATGKLLPVLMHACPPSFNTVEYFENLQTESLGRLLIYAELLGSSQTVLDSKKIHHGLAVVPRQQSAGKGRGGNAWLSPEGCAMFSIQLHIPISSPLGETITLLQHIVATAAVSALSSLPQYADAFDLRLKWPNDIYCSTPDGLVKIGGLLTSCFSDSSHIVCTAGMGLNLSNKNPTTCINEQIELYNNRTGKKLPPISLELYLAVVFTELERLCNLVQNEAVDDFLCLYYRFWLHNCAEVLVRNADGTEFNAIVQGIDDSGYLLVRGPSGRDTSVHPDGNSFDMLAGLISPK